MLFTAKQKLIKDYDLIHSPKITILEGAVRSGKSYVNDWLWWHFIAKQANKNRKFIMTGSTIASLKRNVLDDLERIFGIDTQLNQHNEFEMYGNIIACFGTDKVDSYKPMKGFTAFGWYANEVTEHHYNSIDQAFKRCSGEGSRIFWDTNPANPNHIVKTDYIDRDGELLSNGRVHIKSWHFVLDDNEFLPDEYKESLKKTTPSGMFYDRDILGLWVAAEGIIYKDFDYSRHTCSLSDVPEIREYWAGVDWGFEHYGEIILFGKDHDGKVYQLEEIAETQKGIDWWKERAKELKDKHGNIPFYCDSARPDNISEFKKAGLFAREANKSVVEGISFVAGLYKQNRIVIVRETNKRYLETIYNYRWKENSVKEEPIKEDDDSQDAQRYGTYSHLAKRSGIEILR